mmetsp:Transcript_20702/g.44807  ORF Transcript_20702/g.44807 Transcript_20702/m.44807 type:complete len:112 (+) Transcript_20702:55-390(+)
MGEKGDTGDTGGTGGAGAADGAVVTGGRGTGGPGAYGESGETGGATGATGVLGHSGENAVLPPPHTQQASLASTPSCSHLSALPQRVSGLVLYHRHTRPLFPIQSSSSTHC